ncbi:MAG: type II toxin-antitoxin system HicA family toxin [Gammaproteobacteria bacterium]
MARLPSASGSRVLRALERAGFRLSQVRGSHHYLVKPGVTELVVVPVHGHRDLPKGTLRSILRQAGMTPEQLAALL